jgi:hypothetical protein
MRLGHQGHRKPSLEQLDYVSRRSGAAVVHHDDFELLSREVEKGQRFEYPP